MKPIVAVCTADEELFLTLQYVADRVGYFGVKIAQSYEFNQYENIAAVLIDCSIDDVCDCFTQIKFYDNSANARIAALVSREHDFILNKLMDMGLTEWLMRPLIPADLQKFVNSLPIRPNKTPIIGSNIERISTRNGISLDYYSHNVVFQEKYFKLTPVEFRIFTYFFYNPRRPVSRKELMDAGWGVGGRVDIRTLDRNIGRLRLVFKAKGVNCPIRTVRAYGYIFDH